MSKAPVVAGITALLLILGLMASVSFVLVEQAAAASGAPLIGTFGITPGKCSSSSQTPTGSYFRLIFPGGSTSSGKFFLNANSLCADRSYTLLRPGSQRGLVTGSYQPAPSPQFDQRGSARANSIVRPVSFTGVNLSLSTSAIDPQTRRPVPVPNIIDRSGLLSGQIEALSVAWDKQHFNQGSPKPGGSRPGTTEAITGTYTPDTGGYEMTWTSQIVGGSFNGFVGYWHLQGRFVQSGPSPNPRPIRVPATTTKKTTSTTQAALNSAPSVTLVNCAPVAGGWSSGGLVINKANQTASYHVIVLFTTAAGNTLASASTTGTVEAGKFGFWRVAASFKAPANVHCKLGSR
jgi:hypothetical protein